MEPVYTDSHAHLSLPGPFDEDRNAVIEAARERGVGHILDLSTRLEEADGCIALARSHPGVHAAVGVHPHEASSWSAAVAAGMREKAADPEIVAIGEVGLDYHYNNSTPEQQRHALTEQLALAAELDLPVSVHTREAEEDTIRILSDSGVRTSGGVIHCFTGTESLARACLDLGMYLSFSGIVTFPKAGALREVARIVPLERMLIETDSPYLAPLPHRGRRNQPAFVLEVAARLGRLREMTPDALGRATTNNFEKLFLRTGTDEPS